MFVVLPVNPLTRFAAVEDLLAARALEQLQTVHIRYGRFAALLRLTVVALTNVMLHLANPRPLSPPFRLRRAHLFTLLKPGDDALKSEQAVKA